MISIDKIFIIAFPQNIEKKKELFQERLKSIPIANQVPTEICEVPTQDHIDEALLKCKLRLHETTDLKDNVLTPWKEVSLAIGHWNVWQTAKKENSKSILVLEENFISNASHFSILNTTLPWELLYLGRVSNGGDISAEGGLVTPGYSSGSFAYIITSSGINKIINSGYDQHLISTGEFLTAMHHAHPDKKVTSLCNGHLVALAPMKNLVEQDGGWHNTEDNEDTDDKYTPLHPQLYDAFGNSEPHWVMKYLNKQLVQKEYDLICDEPIDNVFSFPLFTPLFCKEIIEEAEHYGQWTNYRGKEESQIDIRLNSIRFNEIYSRIVKDYLYPLFCYKYQLRGDAWLKLNSQNFIVRYLSDNQGHLGLHNDGSYLSMVVTLNTDYEGGGTIFPKFKKLIKHEQPGYASIHPGLIGYLHGARPVTRGKRYILASFFFPGSAPPIIEGSY
jgi:hypothetical protein